MGQSLAEKDTAWLARFVEDQIRAQAPSALVNISAEEIVANDMLTIADQLQASQQAIDYMRPPPQILLSNASQTSGFPHTHNVTVARYAKNAVLMVQAGGYTTSAGAASMGVVWDGVNLGTANYFFNVANQHEMITPVAFTLTEVAAGAHTLQLTNAGNMVCDANDRTLAILYGG